jgi:hypothetical protein
MGPVTRALVLNVNLNKAVASVIPTLKALRPNNVNPGSPDAQPEAEPVGLAEEELFWGGGLERGK